MKTEVMYSGVGHVMAIAGAVSLHAGLAAWAMQPSSPTVIPQQQIIQIAMVAPSSLAQAEVKKVEEKVEEVSDIPPQDDGMRKITLAEEPTEPKKLEEEEKQEQQASAQTVLTSGQQSPDSELLNAAVTEPVFEADYLKNPAPVYPKKARRNNIQGKVYLDVLVSTEGTSREIKILQSSGSSLLDREARKTVKKWQFVPARRGSTVVEKSVIVPIDFKLKG